MNRKQRRQGGFTLVEIMVVVIIIGILATIVAQNVIGEDDVARVTKVKSDIATFDSAIERFRLKKRRFPESFEELIEANYLKVSNVPKDPWDNEYLLEDGEGRFKYIIRSLGPDGEQDTEDDITNANMAEYKLPDQNEEK
jgi:general secretion pathway protein G